MKTTLIDTETIGFVGTVCLIQYKTDNGPVILYSPWKNTVRKTLDLIEEWMDHTLVAFNFTFDSFHLSKLYNTLSQLPMDKIPDPVDAYVAERHAWKGKCLKPKGVIDLFLLLKDTNFQFLNKRKSVLIKSVPIQCGKWLHSELMKWDLNQLLFAKKANGYQWDIKQTREGFLDFTLSFDPSSGLKPIVHWLFGVDVLSLDIKNHPPEKCPFSKKANSHYKPFDNGWIDYLPSHIRYWENEGKQYAIQDVLHLQLLKEWFAGNIEARVDPEQEIDISNYYHQNSELAWQVGVVRQRGFGLNLPLIREKLIALQSLPSVPIAPRAALTYLLEVATPVEKIVIKSTDDTTLQELMKLDTPVGKRAKEISEHRSNEKKILLFRRLLDVKRYHPNFSVIGTFSNRMSGTSGINPQGIDRSERKIFTFNDMLLPVLSGGDFDSQELTIASRVYEDGQMSDDLINKFDIHANAAKALFPDFFCSYCSGKGRKENAVCPSCNGAGYQLPETVSKEQRYVGKNGLVFPVVYGSIPESIHHRTGISLAICQFAYDRFFKRYKGAARFRDKIARDFCSMIQPKGIGTEVIWNDPKDFIESLFGHRRYFDVENYITRALYVLGQSVPRNKDRVERKPGKMQTANGATSSALYAAAFNIQAKNLRQAGNHVIQSTGAGVTKTLQCAIWSLQPVGVNDWRVCPYNVHDEIMVSNNCPESLSKCVQDSINDMRKTIPLLAMTWKESLSDWSKK